MPDSVAKYLNKTGLETYNESLPHSPTQVQGYVNDWLDEHPEATTTVQDGAVTTPKLANGGVTYDKLAQDVREAIESSASGSKLAEAAKSILGAPISSMWTTRESTGIGAVTVESIQGTTVVQNDALVPVRIAGIKSTNVQGNALDSVEWTAQTLRGAGAIGDMLYSDHVETRVGVVDLGTLDWVIGSTSKPHRFLVIFNGAKNNGDNTSTVMSNASCAAYETVTARQAYDGSVDKSIGLAFYNGFQHILISDSAYSDAATFKTAMSGVLLFYELKTPTTTTISPALSMSYKVEQGGTESIIVPEGEVSAAPLVTVSEGESAADLVMAALAAIAAPDGPTATTNHAVNTYLTMNGKLYKVTAAIATGETIVAGTNVTQTTVMDELIARTS